MSEPTCAYVLVRNWGAERVHEADSPPTAPAEAFGSPFTAVLLPAVMRCGAILRGRLAVQMLPDAALTCPTCLALRRSCANDEQAVSE